ncbi:MAG: cation:dicarboxylate symporter family transporter [Candidatus Muiribacteriota bacterium]
MNKINLIVIFIFFTVFAWAVDFENLPGIDSIVNRGYIKAGICESETPPFFYKDENNEYTGIDIELLKEIASSLGVDYKLVVSDSFDEVILNVSNGNTDLAVSNLSITLDRAKKVLYTQPYIKLKMGLFINHRFSDSFESNVKKVNFNVKDVEIGVLADSSYEFFARELFPDADIIPMDSWDKVIDNILNENIEAGFYDEVAIERTLRQNPSISINLKKVLIDEKNDPIAIAVSPENKFLNYWLEHFLNNRSIKPLDYYFDDFFAMNEISDEDRGGLNLFKVLENNFKIFFAFGIIFLIFILKFASKKDNFKEKILPFLLNPYVAIAGMILGIFYGLIIEKSSPVIFGIGDLYLTYLQMCSLPIMITAIITSLGKIFCNKEASSYIKKLIFMIALFLIISSLSGFIGGLIGNPGSALSEEAKITLGNEIKTASDSTTNESTSLRELVKRIIPANIFSALSQGDILGVLFFSILLGLALGLVNIESSDEIFAVLDALFNSFLKIINWSLYFLPLALFSLMAKQTFGMGPHIMIAMSRFVIIYHIICLLGIFILLMVLSGFLREKVSLIIKKLKNALLVAFGTSNSYAAMPLAIESIENKFQVDRQATNLIMPLGTTVCKPGTIVNLALGTVFIAQLFEISLISNFNWLIVVAGVIVSGLAASGAPGAIEISMLSIFFPLLGLPMEVAFTLLLAVNSITDPIRTMLNILSNSTITILISPKNK